MILHDNGMQIQTKRIVVLALFVAIASVLHTVEGWMLLPFPVPGVKLGLANIISLLVIVIYGWGSTFYVVLLRILLGSLISGTFSGLTFAMSLAGGTISAAVMYIVYRIFCPPFSLVGVSVFGATAHCVVQVIVTSIAVANFGLIWYVPYMLLLAVPTGFATGIAASFFLKKTSALKF